MLRCVKVINPKQCKYECVITGKDVSNGECFTCPVYESDCDKEDEIIKLKNEIHNYKSKADKFDKLIALYSREIIRIMSNALSEI